MTIQSIRANCGEIREFVAERTPGCIKATGLGMIPGVNCGIAAAALCPNPAPNGIHARLNETRDTLRNSHSTSKCACVGSCACSTAALGLYMGGGTILGGGIVGGVSSMATMGGAGSATGCIGVGIGEKLAAARLPPPLHEENEADAPHSANMLPPPPQQMEPLPPSSLEYPRHV